MRRYCVFTLALLAAVGSAQITVPHFKNQQVLPAMPGTIMVRAEEGVDLTAAGLGNPSLEVYSHKFKLGWYMVSKKGADQNQLVNSIKGQTGVAFVSPVAKDNNGLPMFFTNQMVVAFEKGVDGASILRSLGYLEHIHALDAKLAPGLFVADYTGKNGLNMLQDSLALAARPDVKMARPASCFSGRPWMTPNDPLFANQWGHWYHGQLGGAGISYRWVDMNVRGAWDNGFGNPSVGILLLDDGIDLTHPDLAIAGSLNFLETGPADGTHDYQNEESHGTWVAGVIAARTNNGIGGAGVAPGCSLFAARVHTNMVADGSNNGFFYIFVDDLAFLNAVIWGLNQGCRVSNNSNSYATDSALIETAYSVARGNGMVNFAASGNQGSITTPATYETVNCVTGVNPIGQQFGDTGDDVEFAAPGWAIQTTDPAGNLGQAGDSIRFGVDPYVPYFAVTPVDLCGTSFASAYVAGIAGLMISANPELMPNEIELVLKCTAKDGINWDDPNDPLPGFDDVYGYGYPDATKAVGAAGLFAFSATPMNTEGGRAVKFKLTPLFPALADVGGANFNITSSNNAVFPIDTSLNVTEPATFGQFNATPRPVDVDTPVDVKATMGNISKTIRIVVSPPKIIGLQASKASFVGGNTIYAKITLSNNAGPSGVVVSLSSSHSTVQVPPTATVPANSKTVNFNIVTQRVVDPGIRTVTATLRGVSKSVDLFILPPETDIQSIAVSPTTLQGGAQSAGTVTLKSAAPVGGARVYLADNSSVVTISPTVLVAQGATTATFTVYTQKTGTQSVATLIGTYEGVSKSCTLTVTPTLEVTGLTLNPLSVRGGFDITGRVEVYSYAPAGGTVVTTWDNNGWAATPATVTIPYNSRTATFTIHTFVVAVTQNVTVAAQLGTTRKTATFAILH